MTANDLAGSSGKHPDTIRKRWAKKFPGVPYSGTAELSAEELRVLSGKENGTRKRNAEKRMPSTSLAFNEPAEENRVHKVFTKPAAVPKAVPLPVKKTEPETEEPGYQYYLLRPCDRSRLACLVRLCRHLECARKDRRRFGFWIDPACVFACYRQNPAYGFRCRPDCGVHC